MSFNRQVGRVIEEGINLSSAEFKENSYKIYKNSRESQPVLFVYKGELGTEWLITRYEDAKLLLKDQRLKKIHRMYFQKERNRNFLRVPILML